MSAAHRTRWPLVLALPLAVMLAACGGGATPSAGNPSGGEDTQTVEQTNNPTVEQTGGLETPRPDGGGGPSVAAASLPVGGGETFAGLDPQCVGVNFNGDIIAGGSVEVTSVTFGRGDLFRLSGGGCGSDDCRHFTFRPDQTHCAVEVEPKGETGQETTLILRGQPHCDGTVSATDCTTFKEEIHKPSGSGVTLTQATKESGSTTSTEPHPSGTPAPVTTTSDTGVPGPTS